MSKDTEVVNRTPQSLQVVEQKPILISDHELLHTLWTKAVGTPDYNKREWKELEARLLHNRRGIA